ncbi:AAA family ATPase [Psychromonas aquimarina]|uniref:AAA family ATPase n=1 Tax=Psychromonas aquimarina TaxID=444919 RepID=UPI00040A2B74|nr:AAA family ATPase [Psychromonas aquimarina]
MSELKEKSFDMSVFGFDGTGVQVQGFERDESLPIPTLKEEYIFHKDTLRDVINFIDCAFDEGLLLKGPTGCGKTSVIQQVLSRLNYPTQLFSCGGSTEFMDLVGQWTLVKGETVWMDGCLTIAMRDGHSLILDEVDLVAPEQLANLNAILDGDNLVISQLNGKVIKPHKNFRIFATANNANSDSSGLYAGTQPLNIAFMDRFRTLKVDYAAKEVEVDILGKVASAIPPIIRENMVELANKVRTVFKGESDTDEVEMSVTFSTRTLVRWAIQTQRCQRADCAISYALDRALLNRCSDQSEVEAINAWAIALFGDEFKPESMK